MKGGTHILFGTACYLTAVKAGFVPGDFYYYGPQVIGALLPDIDHQGSAIGRRLWPISYAVTRFSKHRGFTHSAAAFLFLVIILLFLKAFFLRQIGNAWLVAFFIGYASHIAADMFTVEGVELLWPENENYRLMRLKTGGFGEMGFFIATAAWLFVLGRHDFMRWIYA